MRSFAMPGGPSPLSTYALTMLPPIATASGAAVKAADAPPAAALAAPPSPTTTTAAAVAPKRLTADSPPAPVIDAAELARLKTTEMRCAMEGTASPPRSKSLETVEDDKEEVVEVKTEEEERKQSEEKETRSSQAKVSALLRVARVEPTSQSQKVVEAEEAAVVDEEVEEVEVEEEEEEEPVQEEEHMDDEKEKRDLLSFLLSPPADLTGLAARAVPTPVLAQTPQRSPSPPRSPSRPRSVTPVLSPTPQRSPSSSSTPDRDHGDGIVSVPVRVKTLEDAISRQQTSPKEEVRTLRAALVATRAALEDERRAGEERASSVAGILSCLRASLSSALQGAREELGLPKSPKDHFGHLDGAIPTSEATVDVLPVHPPRRVRRLVVDASTLGTEASSENDLLAQFDAHAGALQSRLAAAALAVERIELGELAAVDPTAATPSATPSATQSATQRATQRATRLPKATLLATAQTHDANEALLLVAAARATPRRRRRRRRRHHPPPKSRPAT